VKKLTEVFQFPKEDAYVPIFHMRLLGSDKKWLEKGDSYNEKTW
jgi:hypothetical protein